MKGEVLRNASPCNNENDFMEKNNSFTEKLLTRNYSPEEIASASNGIIYKQYKQRMTHLLVAKNRTAPPLFKKKNLSYTPHIKTRHLKQALIKHWNIIAGDPQLSPLFPDRPIIACKRAPDFKDLLVKSRLTLDQESNETEESYGDILLDALIAAL